MIKMFLITSSTLLRYCCFSNKNISNTYQFQVKLGLTVGANDSIGELRCTLSNDTGIPLGKEH